MTPERWRKIDELFDAALQVAPGGRESWLREVCQGDDGLRLDVERLLAQDEGADRNGFLTPAESSGPARDQTGSWPPHDESPRGGGSDRAGPEPVVNADGFSPKAAIAAGTMAQPMSETPSAVRARLRELPILYILILTMTLLWRYSVLGHSDLLLDAMNVSVIVSLAGVTALLSSRLPLSLGLLKALELGVIATIAILITVAQYRMMLVYSLREDLLMAQLTMKNVTFLTSVLILSFGLYVPKSFRRAGLVAGPLALLPFATLLALFIGHPEAMAWLGRGWRKSDTPRIFLLTFDAMLLVIVALGSTYGARTISLLRRQVAEARQLGQYKLRRRIGGGGMGEVYLAEHQLLKRPCALKLIRPDAVAGSRALMRFEQEVRLTATLSHPNTVEIYDYGRAEDGTYYYVMEYLPGLSLADLVERHGPLPPSRAVYLLRQVCMALREAHAAGLIHRDIKPSNVFASKRGGIDDVAKLLDFGLVRPASTSHAPHLSEEGQILGTPLFMSPEQATGSPTLDERSDIYSLGAVAYYLLTGRPPFDEGGGISVMIAHARDPVVPPSRVVAGIPGDLESVVLRCLAKPPAERFQTAEGLERALGECACAGEWDQGRAARWWAERARGRAS